MRVVLLLKSLLSRRAQIMAANRDHVVTAIGGRIPNGFVLAHQEDSNGGGDAAQRPGISTHIDIMPCP